jgi:cobalt/nickel transport system permease protein
MRDPPIPQSPVSRWDPRWKLASLSLSGIMVALIVQPITAGLAAMLCLALAFVARLPLRVMKNRLGLIFLAVLPMLVVLPLTTNRQGSGWTLGWLFVSEAGLTVAVTIALRALAIGTLALVVLRTNPFAETLAAAHALRWPSLGIQIAQLAYRYAFLLFEEARRLRIALRTRGFRAAASAHSYRTSGQAVGTLLIRGFDRAERVADAMRCRGFDGRFHSLNVWQTRPADVLGFLLVVALAAGVLILDQR